jgi:uncharacterized membrane protein
MADAANDIEEHGFKRTLKDLFAGAAGGVAQVLLGMWDSISHVSSLSFSSRVPRLFTVFSLTPLTRVGGSHVD